MFLIPIFTTRRASDPKVMGTVESGSSRWFFWHLAKSNRTNGYRDINCWENSGMEEQQQQEYNMILRF